MTMPVERLPSQWLEAWAYHGSATPHYTAKLARDWRGALLAHTPVTYRDALWLAGAFDVPFAALARDAAVPYHRLYHGNASAEELGHVTNALNLHLHRRYGKHITQWLTESAEDMRLLGVLVSQLMYVPQDDAARLDSIAHSACRAIAEYDECRRFAEGPFAPSVNAMRVGTPTRTLTCAACGYTWTPRKLRPRMCPRCHTATGLATP